MIAVMSFYKQYINIDRTSINYMSAAYISSLMIITETLTWKLPCRDNYRAVKTR